MIGVAGETVAQQAGAIRFCHQSVEPEPAAVELRVGGDGGLAAAAEPRGERPLGIHDDAGRGVIQSLESVTRTGIVRAAFDADHPLADRR